MSKVMKVIKPLGALAIIYLGVDLVINPDAIAEPILRWSMGTILALIGLQEAILMYKEFKN